MSPHLANTVQRVLGHLAGAVLLTAGLTLIGGPLLLRPWLECRELTWKRDLMRLQSKGMAEQKLAYQQFITALERGDPVLLQRLAFHQFRLKPQGVEVLGAAKGPADAWPTHVGIAFDPNGDSAAASPPPSDGPDDESPAIEAWLHKPMPVVGVDYPPLAPLQTRLVRLCTGPARLGLFAVGAVCLMLGMAIPGPAAPQAEAINDDEADEVDWEDEEPVDVIAELDDDE